MQLYKEGQWREESDIAIPLGTHLDPCYLDGNSCGESWELVLLVLVVCHAGWIGCFKRQNRDKQLHPAGLEPATFCFEDRCSAIEPRMPGLCQQLTTYNHYDTRHMLNLLYNHTPHSSFRNHNAPSINWKLSRSTYHWTLHISSHVSHLPHKRHPSLLPPHLHPLFW